MWSKGERSAQISRFCGVILGVTILMLGQSSTDANCQSWHKDICTQWIASQLNTSLEICAGLVCSKPCRHLPSCAGMSWRKRGTWPWACQLDVEQRGEISSDLEVLWCYSWCDHFDVRAKHYRCQLSKLAQGYLHSNELQANWTHLWRSVPVLRAANHVGTFRHAQVWVEGNVEHDHEPASWMWSKGERSAQISRFCGVILGVNRKLPLLDEIRAFYCRTFWDWLAG